MLIVCVCVHVCVFTGLKRFSGPLHLKIQPKCGYTAMSSALLKNSKPGKGVQAPYGPRPHIHTHTHTQIHRCMYSHVVHSAARVWGYIRWHEVFKSVMSPYH